MPSMWLVCVLAVLMAQACGSADLQPIALNLIEAQNPQISTQCQARPFEGAIADDFKPILAGKLALEQALGTSVLSSAGYVATAWSEDGSEVMLGDSGAITVWRADDGALLEHYTCPGPKLVSYEAGMSPDGRWLVVSGGQDKGSGLTGVTCVVDRRSGRVTMVELSLVGGSGYDRGLFFEASTGRVIGDGAILELEAGVVTRDEIKGARTSVGNGEHVLTMTKEGQRQRPRLVSRATGREVAVFPSVRWDGEVAVSRDGTCLAALDEGGIDVYALPSGKKLMRLDDAEGAEQIVLSSDCSHVAGWTLARVVLLGEGEADKANIVVDHFLAVWDLGEKKRLWRDETRCCNGWRFSVGGQFLEAKVGRVTEENLRVSDGTPIGFPGMPRRLDPTDQRLVLATDMGLEIWSADPPRALVAPGRHRLVARRGGAEGQRVTRQGSRVMFERGQMCVELGVGRDIHDVFAFSDDGSRLFAGVARRDAALYQWDTADGALVKTLRAEKYHMVYPLPRLGAVAFSLRGGLQMFDMQTGASRGLMVSPEADGTRPGPVWTFPGGQFLVGRDDRRPSQAHLWTAEKGVGAVFELPGDARGAMAVSADMIAAGSRNGEVAIWSVSDETPLVSSTVHGAKVRHLAFSPDGAWLASSAEDGKVVIQAVPSGETQGTVELRQDAAVSLWWSPDSTRLTIDTERRFGFVVGLVP